MKGSAYSNPIFFKDQALWRKWLEDNHEHKTEVFVGLYKKKSGKESIDWSHAVDEALCFGWIDGRSQSLDEERWAIRFTPRKPTSIWSAVNINKVKVLTEQGQMRPAGIAAFEKRKEERSKIYAFEQGDVTLDKDYEKKLKANKKAWDFFKSKGASYQKIAMWWVMSAKQETTRLRRLDQLIKDSEMGMLIPSQRRPSKKT